MAAWCAAHADATAEFEKQMRRKVHYVVEPAHLWRSIAELARTQSDKPLLTCR